MGMAGVDLAIHVVIADFLRLKTRILSERFLLWK